MTALRRHYALVLGACLLAGAAALTGASLAGGPPAPAALAAAPPPRLPACVAARPVPCYGQDPVYGASGLYARGITGAGTTIAVVIPDAGPWAARDLAVYDRSARLPAAGLESLSYDGARPGRPRDPATGYWQQEGALDLEMAHFMAPGARLAWLAARQRVDVASFSCGLYEAGLAASGGYGQLTRIRAGLRAASAARVRVIAGSGESGPAGPRGAGWYRFRTVAWPTSDPLVTGVTAATARITPRGTLAGPWTVCRDRHGGVGGGGLSAAFPRPAYQDQVASVTGTRRGVPDIAMDGAARAYVKVAGVPGSPGWITARGTSVSAPLLAGLAADAAQPAGHPPGPLSPLVCQLHGPADGITNVTAGTSTGRGVTGYRAGPGYDLASGVGTVRSAAPFAAALARPGQQPSGQR
jgi:subtilase family serine protease